ncbi:MAG: pilus assembly PilX N-terminal domain-containing protein [Thermodesulfobacteriota bacterium]|nr:pilus assembly PilX N-terminal domain-containing protein [Thermodesulfobacteriota bacterium]
MKRLLATLNNEQGSVLVLSILILALLSLVGIAAITTSTIENKIAGNEKFYKIAFYEAEGGTELGAELIEENICCPAGFSSHIIGSKPQKVRIINDDANVNPSPVPLAFWQNELTSSLIPDDDNRHVYFPSNYTGLAPHTNITFSGVTRLSTGSPLQMAAGYEGVGKGAGGGGMHILYEIYSQHKGKHNSKSVIMTRWRHVVGKEGACKH